MSPFETIPVEIFDMICSHLEIWADVQSLRLTCKSFKNIIPVFYHTLLGQYVRPANDTQTRILLSRLLKEGNLFHRMELRLCGFCNDLRPEHRFSDQLGYDFLVNEHGICCECIKNLIVSRFGDFGIGEVHYVTYNYYKCKHCSEYRDDSEDCMHPHFLPHSSWKLCDDCHLDICRDADCLGWPKGYNEEHLEFLRTKGFKMKEIEKVIQECKCTWCSER